MEANSYQKFRASALNEQRRHLETSGRLAGNGPITLPRSNPEVIPKV